MAKNPYEILGVSNDASAEDIKKAYRKLSKEWHPDKHKGEKGAEEKFKEINQAYEILSDPKKRQTYDQFGSMGGQSGGFDPNNFDFSSFSGMGDFGDIFETFFGGGRGGGRRSQRGADREVQIDITFGEVLTGTAKTLRIRTLMKCETCDSSGAEPGSKIETCDKCKGTGQVTRVAQSFFGQIRQTMMCDACRGAGKKAEKQCHSCSGEGRRMQERDIEVEVPAGIEDGQSLRLNGQGDAGPQGAPAGDLYVHIRVRGNAKFERDGADVRSSTDISVPLALLGGEIEVETVQGMVKLKIPEGTQPSQVFRIKGKGFPVLGTSRMGDHYVVANIVIPKKLSKQEKKLIEEWKEVSSKG